MLRLLLNVPSADAGSFFSFPGLADTSVSSDHGKAVCAAF